MTVDNTQPDSNFVRSLRRAAIKLAIGLAVIWGTVFIVDQKMNRTDAPAAQAEATVEE